MSRLHSFILTFMLFGMISAGVMLASCAQAPNSTTQTTNSLVPVDRLFNIDGCTVYRFDDAGHYHYFTKCANSQHVETSSDEYCGKGCTRQDNITTSKE